MNARYHRCINIMGDSSDQPKDVVFVTGFGPFGNHVVNSSWVSVRELSEEGLGVDDVELRVAEIPVEYDTVRSTVPELWKKHKPKLMVHVGVSGIAKELTLEQQAHNDGYDKLDVQGCLPSHPSAPPHCCCSPDEPGVEKCLVSRLRMGEVCDAVLKDPCDVQAVVSYDPGRYLCDFIYYTSLHINKCRTAFIHVPPLDKPYSGKQLADGLRVAIKAMLQQL